MTIYENIQNYKQTHFPLKRTCVASSSYWHWSFKLYLLSSLKHDGWWFAKGHPKLNRNDLFNRSNTSNRSPKHTRRFKTNYSHMVLVILHMIVILYYLNSWRSQGRHTSLVPAFISTGAGNWNKLWNFIFFGWKHLFHKNSLSTLIRAMSLDISFTPFFCVILNNREYI